VPERVRGDVLLLDRRAVRLGCPCVLGDEPFDGVARERSSCPGGEQRVARGGTALSEPGSQRFDGLAGQRRCPVFAALSVASDVRPGAEVGVLADEAGELWHYVTVSSPVLLGARKIEAKT
jgi:hypothetical protein